MTCEEIKELYGEEDQRYIDCVSKNSPEDLNIPKIPTMIGSELDNVSFERIEKNTKNKIKLEKLKELPDNFENLNDEQRLDFLEIASNNLTPQEDNVDFSLTEEEIETEAKRLFDLKTKKAENKKPSPIQSVKNALFNVGLDVKKVGTFWTGDSPAMDIASASIYEGMFGRENIDDYISKVGEDSWLAEGLGKKEILDKIPERKEEVSQRRPTTEILSNLKKGNYVDAGAGILSSIINVGGSVVYGLGTVGTGYFMDFAADNYIEFNEEKAKRLGVDLTTLIENGDAEVKAPVATAGVMTALEVIPVFKILAPIKKGGQKIISNSAKKLSNNLMNTKSGKMILDATGTGVTESFTEWNQCALEEYNKVLGQTGDKAKARSAALSALSSPACAEAAVQGFAGGKGMRYTNYVRSALSNVRAGVDVNGIESDFKQLGDLNKQVNLATDAVVKEGIQNKINEVDARLKARITKSNSIVNKLTPENIAEVNTMGALAELQVKRVGELNALKKDGKVNQKDYLTALEGYKSTYLDAKNRIKGIADTVKTESEVEVSEKNQIIADVNTENMSIIKESDNTAKVEAAKNKIVENNQGIINKVINNNFDPTVKDGISLNEFKAEVNLEVSELIRTWKPGSAPFGAYLKDNLPLRIPGIFDRQIETKEDGDFVAKTDVTEQVNIADDTVTVEETIDAKETNVETAADKLRAITGITKEETTEAGSKIIGEKIRVEPVKGAAQPAKRDVSQSGKLKFSTKVIDAMGGKLGTKDNKIGNYVTFLESNGADIASLVNAEPEIKNTVLREIYKPKKVGRTTGKFDKGAGKGVFEYQNENPTAQDFIDWATDSTKGLTTLINRQATLADVLSGLLGRASTLETVATPEGKTTFEVKQELQGKKIKPDTIDRLISDIDIKIADLNKVVDKYKGTLATGITPGAAAKVVIAGLKIIKKGLQAGLTFQKALTQGLEYIKKNLKSEAAADIISSEIQNIDDLKNKTEKELEKLMEDVQDAIDIELELGKQSVAYFKDLNSLNIKNTLDLSKFNFDISEIKLNEIKKKRLIKAKEKEQSDFINRGKDIVSAMPIEGKKLFIDGKNTTLLQGLLGFHYRYVGSGKANILYDNISSKTPSWVSERTKNLFAALPENIITANSLKTVQDKINKAKTKAEKIEIAKNNLAKIKQHQIDVDAVYYANQSLLSDYVYSAKNELDLINKIDYVAKIKSTNSNNVNGDRALVKVNGLYIGPKGKKGKLEHVKTSSKQSIQGLEQILSGDIETSITSDFEGVYGFEFDNKGGKDFGFAKIDEAGKTNTSQYYRFNNPVDSKNYILAEFNFDGTIADKNILSIVNDKKRADTTIKNGKQFVKNNPDAIPTVTDPSVLDKDINKIIEDSKGIKSRYKFSDIVAKRRGAGLKSFKIIPASAQDFSGLMYDLYGKGKKGEQQQKWVQNNLIKPYQKGIAEIDSYRQALKNDYSSLLKKFPQVAKKLGKTIPNTEFTFDQALRVNLWTKGGFEIPGLAKRDIKKLNDIIDKDIELKAFNEAALLISKQDKWIKPSAYWDSESLISDLNNLTNKVGRKKYLASFIENADVIFSNENLNKMEVALGTNWREAMEDSLYRMKNGTNRPSGTNKLTNQFNNWVNNSVGAIMFFNVKSALLQTISSVNFLNWSDNNPYKAALAFGNQKQYWSDFSTLWNSPKLKQRRSGLRKDVNEAELANSVKGATNKAQAALSYLLKIGFTPTQMADSFAIASGGATFYRNRINTLKNQGLDQKAAEKQAFEDFAEASDVAQQSADPMLISQQQASPLGRLILAFQNTPAQVTRIFNKSARDFINNRGDQKTNVSKMIYYGAVQGFIFATLQNAAFALIPGFDNEEDEEKKSKEFDKKEERILNSMVDTMLRGSGVYGAIVSTLKNTALTYYREEKKDAFGKDHRNTLLEILNLSPPVGSKVRKINNAIKAKDYNKEVVKEQGFDVTLKGKVNLSPSYQVIASLTEAITNLPLERAVVEIDRVVEMLDARNTTFQRVALALGYRTWDVNTKNEERDLVKIESKEAKEKARKQKVIDDRAERKRLKELEKYKGKTKEEIKQMKRRDSIVDTNKSDQVKSLINLGLTKKEIKELKYEDDRVNKIIELTNK